MRTKTIYSKNYENDDLIEIRLGVLAAKYGYNSIKEYLSNKKRKCFFMLSFAV